jgi:hypothetical protein
MKREKVKGQSRLEPLAPRLGEYGYLRSAIRGGVIFHSLFFVFLEQS